MTHAFLSLKYPFHPQFEAQSNESFEDLESLTKPEVWPYRSATLLFAQWETFRYFATQGWILP